MSTKPLVIDPLRSFPLDFAPPREMRLRRRSMRAGAGLDPRWNVMDGPIRPNITIGPLIVEALRPVTAREPARSLA